MRSLDDAQPAAKTARATASAVKNRHHDAEGGAAFRKTFSDIGHARDTGGKTSTLAAQNRPQPDGPVSVTPDSPSPAAAQAGKLDTAELRNPSKTSDTPAASVSMSMSVEGDAEPTTQTAVTRGAVASTDKSPAEPSMASARKTDALALLSLATAPQPEHADSKKAEGPAPSADQPTGSDTALPGSDRADALEKRAESKSVPTGDRKTVPSAAATLSATLALNAIKSDTERPRAGTAAGALAEPANDEKPSRVGKNLDMAEPARRPASNVKDDSAVVGGKNPETRAPVTALSGRVLPERPAEAGSAETAVSPPRAKPEAAFDVQELVPPKMAATPQPDTGVRDAGAADIGEPDSRMPTHDVAASPSPRQASQVTSALMPEPAEAPAVAVASVPAAAVASVPAAAVTSAPAAAIASAPVAAPNLRSLMAILGPVTPEPAVDVAAQGKSPQAEVSAPMQSVMPEKALAMTQPNAGSTPDVVSPDVATSSLLRQTKQVTSDVVPEPAEEPAVAVASAPAAGVDLRSLMAMLGPVAAKPADDVSAQGKGVEAGAGIQGLKLTGDRINMPVTSIAAADPSPLPASTDGADRVFRFGRADGKETPISLRADIDRPAPTPSNEQANAKAETVTVLDARRYLGIAPTLGSQLPMTANAQAVAAAITGNGDPTQTLQTNAGIAGPQGATGKVVNTLKIQMHPIDLGLVTATLRLRDDELQIDLRVQTGDAYRQLTNDQDAMIKALRAQGFQVDQVNVIFTPQDRAAGNDGSGLPQGSQQQPSQNGRDSQGGLAAGHGGEGRNGGTGQRSTDDGRTRQDTLRETPAASQPGLSDELYL